MPSKCPYCKGAGFICDTESYGETQVQSGPSEKCRHCHGTGSVNYTPIDQIQADALYFLASWVLRQHLPSLAVIGAADCVYHIAKASGFEWSKPVVLEEKP
jgi:hypothetical protein